MTECSISIKASLLGKSMCASFVTGMGKHDIQEMPLTLMMPGMAQSNGRPSVLRL